MKESVEGRWESARKSIIARWREILRRVEARDEGGVLQLANVMDEFCDEAIATRLEVLHGQAPPENDRLKLEGPAGMIGTRCLFCRGFREDGGCFGMLEALNRHVMARRWDEARRVAEMFIVQMESLDLADGQGSPIH